MYAFTLPAGDCGEFAGGQAVPYVEALPQPVRVDVRDPEDDHGDSCDHGKPPQVVLVGLRPAVTTDMTTIVP